MKILRIRSNNMREALAEAERQLGSGVTVLQTREFQSPALFGLANRCGVEILASSGGRGEVAQSVGMKTDPGFESVARQIADIRQIVSRLDSVTPNAAQPEESPTLDRLVRSGVSQTLAKSVAYELSGIQENASILDKLARRVRCAGPINCRNAQARVALVGPTGVGKTTTAAKLAAQQSLSVGKSVALITLDTYRVGAIEQLATYARILETPLEVALCPEDVDALVAKHRDKDVIIVDTVGRSQRNRDHLDELARFVRAATPTEVHLVVSASSSPAVQREAVEAFGVLSADRLVLTKLDECPQPGCLLDIAATSLLPFSYVTFGQEVPDDITLADSRRLARLVWEGMP